MAQSRFDINNTSKAPLPTKREEAALTPPNRGGRMARGNHHSKHGMGINGEF